MAQGKQTPRQKMINLMYLVFIAMMAMQVDRQVLRSFEGITVTMTESTKLTEQNNKRFYDNIDIKAKDDPDYVPVKAKADIVKVEANKVFKVIEEVKTTLMHMDSDDPEDFYKLPEPGSEEETNYSSLSNTDMINKILFKSDKPSPEGEKLKKSIDDFRNFMLTNYTSKTDKDRLNQVFDTSGKGQKSWLIKTFYEQPMVAALANLTKLEADIRTEEGQLVNKLLFDQMESQIQVKAWQPIVMAPPIIRKGADVEANVAFGSFDETLEGEVYLGEQKLDMIAGKATFNLETGSIGKKLIKGKMVYERDGKSYEVPFEQEYEVVSETLDEPPSGAVITADKMNVVYRGLENPISATVNGADGAISMVASVPGLSGSNGKYIFKPSAGSGTVKFTASAKTSTGKTVSGFKEFRIKPVPPPQAEIAGKTNIQVPANALAGQTVRVRWPDFLFEMSAEVTEFKVKVSGQPTAVVKGNKMSGAAGALSKARKGDVVGIFDVKYRSSTGITGTASAVTIEVR
jgi:gliding motility-associated protein GldM